MLRKRQPKGRATSEQAGDPAAALAAAVTLLARREFCSIELAAKLAAKGFTPEAVRAALAELIERHYLDDERYTRQFVVIHGERGQGPLRIRRDLAQLGLPAALIETQLESQGEWAAVARRVLTRRFGAAPPRSWPDKARRMRFLQYRGFATDDIRSALGAASGGAEIDTETDIDTDIDTDP
ncbi:MAG TPA: regulatory protein RecX [Steroidobacteraceae bacterium]|nr:regulatory protein RecX [Steroidobacteraceae bacterium]